MYALWLIIYKAAWKKVTFSLCGDFRFIIWAASETDKHENKISTALALTLMLFTMSPTPIWIWVNDCCLKRVFKAITENVLLCSGLMFYLLRIETLSNIDNTSSKITGVGQRDLCLHWETRVIKKVKDIINYLDHHFYSEFRKLLPGNPYFVSQCRTNRYFYSFGC